MWFHFLCPTRTKNLERSLWIIGYGNEDTVWLQDLRQSKGEAARRQQTERAEVVVVDEGDGPASSSVVWPHSGVWRPNNTFMWLQWAMITQSKIEKTSYLWMFQFFRFGPTESNYFGFGITINKTLLTESFTKIKPKNDKPPLAP